MMMICRQRWTVTAFQVAKRTAAAAAATTTTAAAATPSTATTTARISSKGASLDLKTVTYQLDLVLDHCKARAASEATLQAAQTVSELNVQRSTLIQERDAALNVRKESSATVGKYMRILASELTDEQKTALETAKTASTTASEQAAAVEEQLEEITTQMDELLAGIPNLLDDRVPAGTDESDNQVVSEWGDRDALPAELGWDDDFEPAWHDDVAGQWYAAEAAVRISGARFVALTGPVAQLERALSMFFVDLHSSQHGYTEVTVPYVVGRSALEGTSQLPKFQEDLFAITPESHTCNGEDAFLIPTAEVPVTNLHRGEILEEANLPISYVALTPCFRAEAGSYGRDTKGLIRTHQFHKVEMVKICTAETSDDQHEQLTRQAEECLRALKLPYRKVRLCSGDIGFAARHCYDLEVWLPGAKEYREISSCSNTGDFQARRMSMRYRPAPTKNKQGKMKKSKPQLCHTINGSGLAVGRALVAVLENYQKPDGSVAVPEVLQPYMRGQEYIMLTDNN